LACSTSAWVQGHLSPAKTRISNSG
jgi:hypothetical protein